MKAEARAAALFLAPALAVLVLFFFLPVIAGFALSLTDFDLYALGDLHNVRFVALHNYAAVLKSGIFWTALGNTLYFSLVGGPLTVALLATLVQHSGQVETRPREFGLAAAIAAKSKRRFKMIDSQVGLVHNRCQAP